MNPLRLARFRKDVTLAQVSDATGLATGFLSRLERGKAKPSPSTANKLAKYYTLTVDQVLGLEPLTPEQADAEQGDTEAAA